MVKKHTLSVVIPAYNRSQYITAALDSVLDQKLPDDYKLEVIVIDDGSTDDTEHVLKPYLAKIIYKKIPHTGKPAVPRNTGIRLAKGELIALQDSDDLWAPSKLSIQLPVFDDPNVVLSFGQAKIMDQKGKASAANVVNPIVLKKATNYSALLKENPVSTLTVIARKNAIESVGFFNEADELRAIEDYDLWLRLASAYPKGLKPLGNVLAYYRRHDENISQGDNLKGIENALHIYNSAWMDKNVIDKDRQQLEKYIEVMWGNWAREKEDKDPSSHPVISVVMGVYNGSRFLRPALESILKQTYRNFEFIIIDDGSTDESVEVIKSYKDLRIQIIHQANHGLVYSLNKGISLARGSFIARMDADDLSLPSRFEKELEWLSANERRGLVSTYFSLIDFDQGRPTGTTLVFPTKHIDLRRALYITNPFAHGGAMYRKKAIIEKGMYKSDYGPTEDYELWRRLAKDWEVGLIPEVLYWYRINNPESVSQKSADIQASYVQRIMDEQWAEPFIRKRPDHIIRDFKHIKNEVPNIYRQQVENEYKVHQYSLTKALLEQGRLLQATIMLSAELFLNLRHFFLLLKYVPKGTYRAFKGQVHKRNHA